MPWQLSSLLELSPRSILRVIFFHTSSSLLPSGRTQGIEKAENKRGGSRNTEELGEGTKVRRQCVWELPILKNSIYKQPTNDA